MGCDCLLKHVGTPSLDRPFGVYVWGVFDEVTGKLGYPASSFEFDTTSGLPLTTWTEVVAAIVTYYAVIFGGRELMKSFGAIRLNWLFRLHNLLLTLLSGLLFVLLFEQIWPIIMRHGILYSICDHGSWTQPIVTVYYLNYLTKYYELFDTMFLVLRKKPLTFLHTYHHGATALLCFVELMGRTSVSYVPIILNLWVHVVMYLYYFLCACGIYPRWKEWVTRFQIIQFIIDLVAIYFASYTYFVSTYWPTKLPHMGNCAGEEYAAIVGCGIISSYLFLFIGFYIRVYAKDKSVRVSKTGEKKGPVEAAAKATYSPSPAPSAAPSEQASGRSTPKKSKSKKA